MTSAGFLTLPAEIRNQIYENLFAGAVIEDRGFAPHPIRTQNYHLQITQTNRQIRAESLSVLQVLTTFHFRVGPAGAPPVPADVLRKIRVVRLPAHRLKTFDTSSFTCLQKLVLDVSIDPYVWKLYQAGWRRPGTNTDQDTNASPPSSNLVSLGYELGVFEKAWNLDKIWGDSSRKFRILCWFSMWRRDGSGLKVRRRPPQKNKQSC